MARIVLSLGYSGQGKTRATKNLDHTKNFIINTIGKDLPYPGSALKYKAVKFEAKANGKRVIINGKDKPNMMIPNLSEPLKASDEIKGILTYVNNSRLETKVIFLDDFQYLLSTEFMHTARQTGWDKFNELGIHGWQIFETARSLDREDLTVIIAAHLDEGNKDGQVLMKTIGKMFREKVTPEGYSTITLITDPLYEEGGSNTIYRFRTQTNGVDPGKSPEGMFPLFIPNDYRLVIDRMDEYYREGIELEGSKVLAEASAQVSQDLSS